MNRDGAVAYPQNQCDLTIPLTLTDPLKDLPLARTKIRQHGVVGRERNPERTGLLDIIRNLQGSIQSIGILIFHESNKQYRLSQVNGIIKG